MSDAFYFCLRNACYPIVWLASRPTVLHRERVPRRGPIIIAANHLSPYDIPCLMYASPRPLDFVSVKEVFAQRFTGWLYGSMNAFPLDRHRPDAPTVRMLLHRLEQRRAVAMFPEGAIRTPQTSLLSGGPIKPGIAGLARLANVPVIPCVVVGSRVRDRQELSPAPRRAMGRHLRSALRAEIDLPEADARDRFVASLRAAYDVL